MQTEEAFNIKNYSDREALENNLHHCTLFIHFSENSISLVTANKNHNQVLGLQIIEERNNNIFKKNISEIRSIFDSINLNKDDYTNIKIIIENNCYALVPEPLFAGDKAESFLKLNTPIGNNHQVLFNRLQKNVVNVFSLNISLYDALKQLFPQSEIIHETELLLSVLFANDVKEKTENLFVHVHETYIDIGFVKENTLRYLNSFSCEADTDIIYFLLSVAEELKLNQDRFKVMLLGKVNANGSLISLMKKYISNVELLKRPVLFSYPASFREFAEHQYFIQINSLLCAS